MSDEDIELDYDFMMQQALRYLMRDVLTLVADLGDSPGEHHFYIEFETGALGVDIPEHLRVDYPERMTIVLQHQFDDLDVDEDGFAVTLWFKGQEARLTVPFSAVTSFADPSVQFGLRFDSAADDSNTDEAEAAQAPGDASEAATDDDETGEKNANAGDGADIVSLDAFRKK